MAVLTLPTQPKRSSIRSLVPDDLWEETLRPILTVYYTEKAGWRGPQAMTDQKGLYEAILYRIRTGCPWNLLPRVFPEYSTVYRWYKRWENDGVLILLYQHTLDYYAARGWITCSERAAVAALDEDSWHATDYRYSS